MQNVTSATGTSATTAYSNALPDVSTDIATLGSDEIKALSTATIAGLTTAQLALIQPEAIPGLSSSQLAALPTGSIGALSTDQLPFLDTKQLTALSTLNIQELKQVRSQHSQPYKSAVCCRPK